jgi:type III secretion system YscD/HrpQ family protein
MESREDTIFDEDATPGKGSLAQINFALTDNGRWLLKVIAGPNNGAEFPMQTSSSYIIGTDPNSCDVVFHDTSVSRQHAKITVGSDDRLTIEDLKSRNGTLLDGEPIKGKKPMATNSLISMGTTSFIVFDREGEMKTIISPLLPSIVKVLQRDDGKKADDSSGRASSKTDESTKGMGDKPIPKKQSEGRFGAFILIAILTGLFVIIGMGTATLFKSEPVVAPTTIDPTKILNDALAAFPSVKYSFNKSTGKLLLVGHVLTPTDKNGLLYNLQGLTFIKDIDDTGVVIDEYVWQEINQLLSRNTNWKSITIQAAKPGHFVITGYLQTRKQAEQLNEYLSANFPYLDLLEKRVLVDEEVINTVSLQLQNIGVKDVNAQLSNGELTLMGTIAKNKISDLQALVVEIRKIPGVRNVKNFVTELAPEASMINVSDRYQVTGFSQGANNVSVVINGRILSQGDVLDGMTITTIKPNVIFLEKDGVKYRIDYSR